MSSGERKLRVGVITVPGFYEDIEARRDGDENYRSTTRDVRRLIGELQADGGIDALVLDLRGDGGGFLPEATALTGLFIDQGPVVQLRDTDGRIEVLGDPEAGVVYAGPLAVLVDRTSASASEIFAGAIQDYHRGLVLGQTTFGKGTVQKLIPLDRWSRHADLGQLTVTIGKFYRVTGESTQLRGVVPDIELPSPIDPSDVGESVLHYALPWDRIAAVGFRVLPDDGSVAELTRAQTERTAADARLPLADAGPGNARDRAQGAVGVAEPEAAAAGTGRAGTAAHRAGERAPQPNRACSRCKRSMRSRPTSCRTWCCRWQRGSLRTRPTPRPDATLPTPPAPPGPTNPCSAGWPGTREPRQRSSTRQISQASSVTTAAAAASPPLLSATGVVSCAWR